MNSVLAAFALGILVGFLIGKVHEYQWGYRSKRYGTNQDEVFGEPSWEDPFSGRVVKEKGWRPYVPKYNNES